MNPYLIFFFGVFVGVALGWLLLGLLIMARRGEEQVEQLEREMRGAEDA